MKEEILNKIKEEEIEKRATIVKYLIKDLKQYKEDYIDIKKKIEKIEKAQQDVLNGEPYVYKCTTSSIRIEV